MMAIALFLPQGRGQLSSAFDNTYFSVKVGPNYYLNRVDGTFGVGLDVNYGKWFLNTASMRAELSAHSINKGRNEIILYAHVDALFDIVSSIRGGKMGIFHSYTISGVGIVHNLSDDNDFCVKLGIGADVSLSLRWRLACEISTLIHPSDFDNNEKSSFLPTLMMGLVRDINSNPTRIRSKNETRRFGNDWYLQIALGISSMNYRGLGNFGDRLSLVTPIAEFGVGKKLTKVWNGRFLFSGLYARSNEELFSYYNLRSDMIFDLLGWIKPDEEQPFFTVKPYAGISFLARLDDQSNFLLGTALGLLFSWRAYENNELYIDARYLLTPSRFAHVPEKQYRFSVGLATVSLGYSYYFSNSSFR